METSKQHQLDSMLLAAYRKLGVLQEYRLKRHINEARIYLERSRERYIELSDNSIPAHKTTIEHGRICKLIPLAQREERDVEKDFTRESKVILFLMVEEDALSYVYAYSSAKLYENEENNSYNAPFYRYANLEDLIPDLQVRRPRQICPPTTPQEWESYCMAFAAFIKLCRKYPILTIPHKTELAIYAAKRIPEKEIQVEDKIYKGKLVPLATKQGCNQKTFDNHRYSAAETLFLLIEEQFSCLVLRTTHHYSYFRKIPVIDTPGGVYYQPTQEKHQVEYRHIAWDEIPEDMHTMYP